MFHLLKRIILSAKWRGEGHEVIQKVLRTKKPAAAGFRNQVRQCSEHGGNRFFVADTANRFSRLYLTGSKSTHVRRRFDFVGPAEWCREQRLHQ